VQVSPSRKIQSGATLDRSASQAVIVALAVASMPVISAHQA